MVRLFVAMGTLSSTHSLSHLPYLLPCEGQQVGTGVEGGVVEHLLQQPLKELPEAWTGWNAQTAYIMAIDGEFFDTEGDVVVEITA
jgi:hypothetical protein